MEGPVDRWREVRDAVREEVLTRGFNAERNTFTQHYDTDEVDASLLVLPLIGFIKGDDPRMLGTIEAVEKDLMRDGLLLRYRTQTGVDGLAGDEHPFLACSFWLVSAYAAAGRLDDANALFDRLVGLANDVGLLSEEYDAGARPDGRQLPAGLQPPGAGAGGLPAARAHRHRPLSQVRWLRRAEGPSRTSATGQVALVRDGRCGLLNQRSTSALAPPTG